MNTERELHEADAIADEMAEREFADVHKQLAACRADLDTAREELGSALVAGDALRALVQHTLNYMRQTDSARTEREVIADLTAGLEGKS